jgi:flagellar motor switch protein FliG
MESPASLQDIASMLSCLPNADAEQLLDRLPVELAKQLRTERSDDRRPLSAGRYQMVRAFVRELTNDRPPRKMHRIDPSEEAESGFHFLAQVPPSQLAERLQHELPQLLAVVLSQLAPELASLVLAAMPRARCTAVIRHLAELEQVDTGVLSDLAAELRAIIERPATDSRGTGVSGRRQLAAIFAHSDAFHRQQLLDAAREAGVALGCDAPLPTG